MKLFGMIRLVLWSFFGVRDSGAHAADLANVSFTLLPLVATVLAVLVGVVICGVVHFVVDPTATMQGFRIVAGSRARCRAVSASRDLTGTLSRRRRRRRSRRRGDDQRRRIVRPA
ncbi:DUF2970 domain-containing protein [Burkholderia latens]|uniref:DUF2970 domain-containing protein n=1 Tax=Burkholderia latens TaxID=488446 RepID=A0A6H9SSQ5_9BURK|nr:DUF2970 domain-containing protein [Burkholderia latens]VWB61487.1 glycerol kinase [Burkholderia latens]